MIDAISATVAMYCLDQFHFQLKEDLGAHKTKFKLLCVKAVLFLSLWQTVRDFYQFQTQSRFRLTPYKLLIELFLYPTLGAIKPSAELQLPDIKISIPCLLLTLELVVISILHIYAFPSRNYKISNLQPDDLETVGVYQGGFFGVRAILEAVNIWDLAKATARGLRWLFTGQKASTDDRSALLRKHPIEGQLEAHELSCCKSSTPAISITEVEEQVHYK